MSLSNSSFTGYSGGSINGVGSIIIQAPDSITFQPGFQTNFTGSNPFLGLSGGSSTTLSGNFTAPNIQLFGSSLALASGTTVNGYNQVFMVADALSMGAGASIYSNYRIAIQNLTDGTPISIGSGSGLVIPNLSQTTFNAPEIAIGMPGYTVTDPLSGTTYTYLGTSNIYVNTAINRPGGSVLFGTSGSVDRKSVV
mgnify:FL=1